jgi:hypothetical protein
MQESVEVGTKLAKKDAPGYILEILELVTRMYSISALADTHLFTPLTAAQKA